MSDIDVLADDFHPSQLHYPDHNVYVRQEKFLAALRGCGNDAHACKLAKTGYRTYELWMSLDRLEFRRRRELALATFCGHLEAMALKLVEVIFL